MMRTIREMMDMRGRVALITGGAGHIGSTIADALAECGASILLLDRNAAACERKATQIAEAWGVAAMPLACDLADEEAIRLVPSRVTEQQGRLDVLVNCAAFVGDTSLPGWAVPFSQQLPGTWRKAMEVNLTACFVLTQVCSDLLAASGHGTIINIASTYGLVGPDMRLYSGTAMGNPAAYAASKGGLIQLTRWLATVLAPKIRINSLTPGGLQREQPAAFRARYSERTPLGRMATVEDMKGAAVYLASDLSSYVTGHNLVVDGGWTAW